VKPATESQKCSYVELVSSADASSQRPKWYVEHSWNMPVKDFVKALTKHAEVRELPDSTAYWVCGYAMNQHDISSDMPADPKESAVFKGMKNSEGMVVVLDEQATPFTRAWCVWTMAMFVQEEEEGRKKLPLDLAAVHEGEARVLTDGFATPKEEPHHKTRREMNFPLELVEKGSKIDITTAHVSRPENKQRLLGSITKSAPDPHRALGLVNTALRSRIAEVAGIKKAIDDIESTKEMNASSSATPGGCFGFLACFLWPPATKAA